MSMCVSLETYTKEGTRPGEMNLISISTVVSFEILSGLCFLKERRLNEEGLDTWRKTDSWGPWGGQEASKRENLVRGIDEGQAYERVEEGREEQNKWLSEVFASLTHLFVVDGNGWVGFYSWDKKAQVWRNFCGEITDCLEDAFSFSVMRCYNILPIFIPN